MLRTMQEFEHGEIPDSLREATEAVVWAEHFVLVFPLRLGTMPAMLKAFLEQVMRPGTAFTYPAKGESFAKSLLRESEMLIGNDMPGEAAIARIAGEERLVTQVFGAGAAIGTMSASVPQPWSACSLPERDFDTPSPTGSTMPTIP